MRSILHRLRTGQRVTLKFRSQPDHGSINELIGGYPLLVSHSENVIRHVAAQAFGFIRDKNARTAVGLSADRQKMYWVCAEDDQTNVNRGMNLEDIADFMIHIGCESALNLDGGGSATMITGKSLMNKPAEGGIERNISNAIILSRVKKNLSGIE
jgi:exopolysaccharide biosynthesis protein